MNNEFDFVGGYKKKKTTVTSKAKPKKTTVTSKAKPKKTTVTSKAKPKKTTVTSKAKPKKTTVTSKAKPKKTTVTSKAKPKKKLSSSNIDLYSLDDKKYIYECRKKKNMSQKGGNLVKDIKNLAIPFAILLAKQGILDVFNNKSSYINKNTSNAINSVVSIPSNTIKSVAKSISSLNKQESKINSNSKKNSSQRGGFNDNNIINTANKIAAEIKYNLSKIQ